MVPTLLVLVFLVSLGATLCSDAGALLLLFTAGALKLSPEELLDFEARFRKTVEDLGFCNAARYLDMDCADVVRTLKNQGRCTLDARRIEQLPLEQVQEWYWRGCERFGVPPRAKRMLKMALAIVDDKETA